MGPTLLHAVMMSKWNTEGLSSVIKLMPKYKLLIQDILILYQIFIIQPVQQPEYYSQHAPTKKKKEARQEDGVSCFFRTTISQVNSIFKGNSVLTKLQKHEQ